MFVNGKEYDFEIRTEEENKRFLELLESAEEKLNQALSEITYSSFENLNKSTIQDIKNIIGNISRIEYGISSRYEPLHKPVKK